MMKINVKSVITSGLVAGVVVSISAITMVPVVGNEMDTVLENLNLPPLSKAAMGFFCFLSFVFGIMLMYLYALIKPRFESKIKAAIISSLIVWVLNGLSSNLALAVYGFMPLKLVIVGIVWGLLELLLASLVGSRLYKEVKSVSAETMKAVICTKYGTPEVLKIDRVEKPVPGNHEILIKIMASAVNSADVRVRSLDVKGFLKIIMQFVLGFNKPRKPVLGIVFSGIVEQTGKKVKTFKNGDEVFGITGIKFGAYAEYITLSDRSITALKPVNATFEEAAAIPFGGHTAIYFLNKAKISEKTSPDILIYGATGSVGTAAIQIAKYNQAKITAVCSESGQELVKELGVDRVILYDREDFSQRPEKFDIIFDAVGKTSKKQCASLLNKNGHYATVGGLETAVERKEHLEFLRRMFESGKYKATIDRTYSIEAIIEAHRYVDTGRKKGNVVIKMAVSQ